VVDALVRESEFGEGGSTFNSGLLSVDKTDLAVTVNGRGLIDVDSNDLVALEFLRVEPGLERIQVFGEVSAIEDFALYGVILLHLFNE